MTQKFALASARDIHPNGPEEDLLIARALTARGAAARIVMWDETPPETLAGEVVVIRTTWNYQEKYAQFIRWLEALPGAGARLVNPLPLLLGTIDKSYLADFRARGFAVPETVVCRSRADLEAAITDPAFADAVIKPCVGAGAIGLHRLRARDPASWDPVDFARPQLLQRFLPEIVAGGELTFVFFGGVYSHAVRKRGKPGDIRVQVDWGGTVEVIEPSPALIAQAAHFLTALPEVPTYARVDAVEAEGNLLLMELEVIEPELFCLYVPGTAERFAEALLSAL
jgi:glutathione synthase/RimK-type ligase-like ATP-grasp enzyme